MYIFFLKWECCKCFSFFLFSFFPVFRVFSSFFLSFSGFPLGWGRCFVVLALWSLLRRLRSVCSLGSLGSLVGCFFVVLGGGSCFWHSFAPGVLSAPGALVFLFFVVFLEGHFLVVVVFFFCFSLVVFAYAFGFSF